MNTRLLLVGIIGWGCTRGSDTHSATEFSDRTATRRVLIEGYRAHDSLSLQGADALRSEFPRHISSDSVHIMTTAEIDAYRSAGVPDDFGGAWSEQDLREAGRVYRVSAIVDVEARQSESGIHLSATRMLLPSRSSPVALPEVLAGTLNEAVVRLARQLAADNVLVGRQ